MKIERFDDIVAWQKARALTAEIYRTTCKGSFSKDYGLTDQIRRASSSIMHNIAEGFDAGSPAEFIRFLRYSYRSAGEVQSELYVAMDVEYISEEVFNQFYEAVSEVKKLISGFIKYLLTQK
jgi:four helix bundle protein